MLRIKAVFLVFCLGAVFSAFAVFAVPLETQPDEVRKLKFADQALADCVQRWAKEEMNQYQRISDFQEIGCAHAGIRSLEGIEQLKELIVVDLSYNPVEDYGPLERLSSSLRFVWLWGISLSPNQFINLRRALPKAWIGGYILGSSDTTTLPTKAQEPSPQPSTSEPPPTTTEPSTIPTTPEPPPFPPTTEPPTDDHGSNAGLTGKEVYLKECAVCHGKEGEGTPRGYQVRFPVQAYADAVTRFGRSGNREFDIPMPAYPVEKISDQQLREMWIYLSSFPRPTTGKELFTAYCANCHGQDGRGGFSGEGILSETGEYRKYIRRGKNLRYPLNRRKYMPAYGEMELSAKDIFLLRQYARDLRQTAPKPSPSPNPYPQPSPHGEHENDEDEDEDEDDD